jgi:hypothetical protein
MSKETNEMEDVYDQRGIGLLMYATTSTCPDIVFPVMIPSQFMCNPGWIHWEVVKDVIHYLKGTADLTLMLGGSVNGLDLAYVNADWASQPHRHSMYGYTVLLHSSLVAWSIWKWSIITLSTAEVEYIAVTAVMCELLYEQALIVELYKPVAPPIPIYCNNQGAITLTSNNKFHTHTTHIDLQYHHVHSLVWSGISIVPQRIILQMLYQGATKAMTHKVASRSRVRHGS